MSAIAALHTVTLDYTQNDQTVAWSVINGAIPHWSLAVKALALVGTNYRYLVRD